MSFASEINDVLEADGTLMATVTGGVYTFDETGEAGLNRDITTGAFDATTGLVKPSIVIRERGRFPDGELNDEAGQYQSARQIVEIYAYVQSDDDTLETIRQRVYTLLHGQQVTGAFRLLCVGHIANMPAPEIQARMARSDYQVVTTMSA